MSPFVLLRVWLRRAPVSSRATAATAAAVVMALLVWIAIPSSTPSSRVTTGLGGGTAALTSPGDQAGQAGIDATGGPASAAGGGSTTGSGTGSRSSGAKGSAGGASTGAQARGAGSAGAQGCSGPLTPLKIGVVLPNVGSGSTSLNSTFGIPPVSEEQADFAAVFDSVNKAGGVACRSLVGDYADFNETDSTAAQTECLKFQQDKVFAVLGGWFPSSTDTCALQNHLPVIEQILIPASQVNEFHPYYMSNAGELDLVFHNFAHALSEAGYFSAAKGFKKVGVFYRDCIAGEYESLVGQLRQVGVPASAITSFNVGCGSSPFAPPSTVEAAILQFQNSGVTDVIPMNEYEDIQAFTRQAQSQGYKPQYLIEDDGIVATSSSVTFKPDPNNFDGAVAISPYQYGAIESGLPENDATKQCDQVMTSHGLPTVYKSASAFAGVVCSLVWMLVAGIEHDPSLNPAALAAGIAAAGSVPAPYPEGPNDFKASNGKFGGQFWRPLQFQSGCACWKVTNPTFSPSFP
ncbi:MAG TPA: ABC transporter substrate-binding protein [Nocardioides sp.]|nr:ABC transporter substrate-binding protein [Nocardioides sp.]